MFHDGDLQSGIALALSQSKLLACFVTDGAQESSLWEEDYLQDDTINPLLSSKAVLLRVESGSQEAGYLSAFCAVSTVPTLVVIHNGQLREYLTSGTSREELQQRLRAVLDPVTPALSQPAETVSAPSSNAEPVIPGGEAAVPGTWSMTSTRPTTPPVTQSPASASASTSTVQRRAEAEAAAAGANPDSAKAKQPSYALQQKKRQQEARLERERIVREIENDKALRREKEEQRKALAKAKAEGNDGADGMVDQQLSSEISTPTSPDSRVCAVQVRLFDGSTIRSKFTSKSTLSSDVRKWVDENRTDGDAPYTFKQILAPLPSRAVTISEEEETLQSLGFTPSVTLVMIPVQGFTAAYNGVPSIVSRGISAGYNVVSGGVGIASGALNIVAGALGTLLGVGQARPTQTEPDTGRVIAQGSRNTVASRPATDIRTLREQQENRDKQQFYNGNTLNFEPHKDQDDERN